MAKRETQIRPSAAGTKKKARSSALRRWLPRLVFLLGLAVFGPEPMAPLTDSGRTMVYAGVMVLVSTFSPALLYHWGLSGTDASVGSVLCSVEMIMATGIGYFVFDEKPTWLCALGIVMILAASAGMNLTPRRKHPSPSE